MTYRANDLDGVVIHFLSTVTVPITKGLNAQSALLSRGHTLTLTNTIIDAGLDRNGKSWLSLLDDPEGQISRWGEVKFARGAFPEKEESWRQGSPEWEMARDSARAKAWAVVDEEERAKALVEVRRHYGAKLTSRQHNQLDGGRHV